MSRASTLKQITAKTALNVASQWVDNPINIRLINNQINCVYRFEHNNQGYYLRITHEKIKSFKALVAAIDFQQHLFLERAPVCQAVHSKQNLFIETVQQDGLEFLAHVCLEVAGTIMNFGYTNKEAYIAWGKALALLHRASQSYQPKEHSFMTWKQSWSEAGYYVQYDSKEIQDLYHSVDAWFSAHTATRSNFGLTHGDHIPNNVLYDGHQINIIDFDEPIYHWFMADIAKPFLDLCNKPHRDWSKLFDWYIEGYRSVLPIQDDELKMINWFTQMKSIEVYLWCKNKWLEPTAPSGQPREEWLSELRRMALTPIFPS